MSAKQKKTRSLMTRYFSVNAIIITLCFLLTGAALSLFSYNYWEREKTALLLDNARIAAELMGKIIEPKSLQIRSDLAVNAGYSFDVISNAINADVFVCSLDGRVILCREKKQRNQDGSIKNCIKHDAYLVPGSIIQEAKEGNYTSTGNMGDLYTDRCYNVGIPVQIEDKVVCIVFASMPVSGMRLFVFDILRMFLISGMVALLLAFMAIYFMTYRMIRPLRSMSEATKRFAKGDFSYRVKVDRNDELGELASAFNSMASSLALLERTRRNFVSNVSHELKTPMTSIGGFIDGILDGTIPKEKQEYYIGIVSVEVKRLSRLITEMLNMSRIEAGEMKLKPQKFDIAKLLFNVLLSFEYIIEGKKIDIHGLEAIGSLIVEGDSDMFHQVIYNLIDNAVKFTDEGGVIFIGAKKKEKTATVTIRNTGIGIPADELSNIFERFYKVDKSRSQDVKSTGLGLYIVKNILQMHGGKISVSSEYGQYCEFTFEIPIKFEKDS